MFRKLANLFGQSSQRARPNIRLAAFGKHPGWLDHMEEIGLETDRLIQLRRMLYSEGINRNIDSGAWRDLTPEQSVAEFKHAFVWKVGPDTIVGRLWSSTDGRGRSLYPMVLAAQCENLSFAQSVFVVMPRLVLLEKQIKSTPEAKDVKRLLSSAQHDFTHSIPADGSTDSTSTIATALARLAECEQLGPDHEGLMRILYQVETDMADMQRTKKVESRTSTMQMVRAHQIRVPRCTERITDSVLLWNDFLNEELAPSIPMLMLIPLDHDWIDLVLGDPTSSHIYALKVSTGKNPLASDIPYSIPDEFKAKVQQRIEEARHALSTKA
ncbi:MAG: hypothetical protein O7G85_11220 [Planctomycetota bacterium]|nr:hypothetical protein [Planctomycetota bacterium]